MTGIQYAGEAGASKECFDAVMRFLQYGDIIKQVRILSSSNNHGLLLTLALDDIVAIKFGFASGYLGEGPQKFSIILKLLEAHGADIEEYEVEEKLLDRLDDSALTASDVEKIDASRPVRPVRWYEYVELKHDDQESDGTLWKKFRPVIPFAIIDSRIIDLAVSFWENPDEKLLTAYRRLEDIVRERSGTSEHGAKLFSQVFHGSTPILRWENINGGKQAGRASLFTGVYQAYRNPRAHREPDDFANDQLPEFFLLNHLYLLEKESSFVIKTDQ